MVLALRLDVISGARRYLNWRTGAIQINRPHAAKSNEVLLNLTQSDFSRTYTISGALQVAPAYERKAAKGGWGARIRTWECRNQNPVPYRLATPQGSRTILTRARSFNAATVASFGAAGRVYQAVSTSTISASFSALTSIRSTSRMAAPSRVPMRTPLTSTSPSAGTR